MGFSTRFDTANQLLILLCGDIFTLTSASQEVQGTFFVTPRLFGLKYVKELSALKVYNISLFCFVLRGSCCPRLEPFAERLIHNVRIFRVVPVDICSALYPVLSVFRKLSCFTRRFASETGVYIKKSFPRRVVYVRLERSNIIACLFDIPRNNSRFSRAKHRLNISNRACGRFFTFAGQLCFVED